MTVCTARTPFQRGMTVIELAITISLIGVMFFFALKGTAMIESMRAVATAYEIQQFQRLVLAYQSDFKELPGDDPNGARRWGRPPALTPIEGGVRASKEGNGKIEGQFFDGANPAGEQFTAWRDLRSAGKVAGDSKAEGISALPENPFNGFYGFDEGNLGQEQESLCASKIPGRAAQMIDNRIDDGKVNTGNLVATSKFSIEANHHFDAPDTAPYDFEKEYIICVPMLP